MLCNTRSCKTEGPASKDQPFGHKNLVFQDRWYLVTGSDKAVASQERWPILEVVS